MTQEAMSAATRHQQGDLSGIDSSGNIQIITAASSAAASSAAAEEAMSAATRHQQGYLSGIDSSGNKINTAARSAAAEEAMSAATRHQQGYLSGIDSSGNKINTAARSAAAEEAMSAATRHQQGYLSGIDSSGNKINTAARSAAAEEATSAATRHQQGYLSGIDSSGNKINTAARSAAAEEAMSAATRHQQGYLSGIYSGGNIQMMAAASSAAAARSREVQRQGQQYSGIHQQRDLPNGRSIGAAGAAKSGAATFREVQPHSSPERLRIAVPYCVVSIFRVPKFLKKSKNKHAYVPQTVSLGLINRKVRDPMKIHKKRAVNRMARRFNINRAIDSNYFFSDAKAQILQVKDEISNRYAEIINSETEEIFVENMVLDGCFILEILRTLGGDQISLNNDYEPIFETNKIDYTGLDILNDFLMLENQIPLIILQKLLELAESNSSGNVQNMLLKVLVINPSAKFYPFIYDTEKWSWPQSEEPVHHLLGLLHSMIVSPPHDHCCRRDGVEERKRVSCAVTCCRVELSLQIDHNGFKGPTRIPCAVALKNAGIRFQHCNGGIKNIYFRDHTIHLPPICITDHTEVLFRNLMALELCKASEINYVNCYVSLMDQLIDSKEDVALLIRDEVITNYLGSDGEVAELFNGLCKGVTVSRTDYFGKLKQDVYKQYKNKIKVQFAEFANEYLSSPWRTAALTGAIIALVLAIVQTIFSILSVVL